MLFHSPLACIAWQEVFCSLSLFFCTLKLSHSFLLALFIFDTFFFLWFSFWIAAISIPPISLSHIISNLLSLLSNAVLLKDTMALISKSFLWNFITLSMSLLDIIYLLWLLKHMGYGFTSCFNVLVY
jgi:hypothetical protein